MKRFNFLLMIFCLFVPFMSYASPTPSFLWQFFSHGKKGDYVVIEIDKNTSLLALRSISPTAILIEEISVPTNLLTPPPTSWKEWVKQQAPGHTSWSMMEIELPSCQIMECYSFSRSTWMVPQQTPLTTLLKLPLEFVNEQERRRIGPPPLDGENDYRKIWYPPFFIEGKKQNAECDVFQGTWPADHSEFAGYRIALYFDRLHRSCFPIWTQIDTPHITVSLRMVDTGKALPTIHPGIPRRIPEFMGTPQQVEGCLRFLIKSPKYYKNFELFALTKTAQGEKIYPIAHTVSRNDTETLYLEVNEEDLLSCLPTHQSYTWLLVPSGNSEYYCELNKPFYWRPIKKLPQ